MAREAPMLQDGVLKAAADLSAKQFYCVKISAADTVDLVGASTDTVYGILQNKPTANLAADVAFEGVCKGISGATLAAGALLMSHTDGKLRTRTSGNFVVGIAVTASGGDGQLITVQLMRTPVIT